MILRRASKGDLVLTPNGKEFVTVEAADHTQLKIERRLRLWLGEWFLDQRVGMPYKRDVLGQKFPIPVIRSMFWRALETTAGVVAVITVDVVQLPKRRLDVRWSCKMLDGSIVTSQPFIIDN